MENDLWLERGKRRPTSGPDGKEAWCVALAACFINFITAGIGRSSGILYVNFIDIFKIDRKEASYPITIRSLTRNLFGPLVGILGQKYGVRCIIFIGGLLAALSSAACFCVKDIFWITVLWGAFGGVGMAMITTLFQASITEHFVKHKSVAAGMGFSGGCVGAFLFPGVFDSLIHEYGIQGTLLLMAGILMQVLPAAMMLKKPTWLGKKIICASEVRVNCDAPMCPGRTEKEMGANENDCDPVNEMEPLKPSKDSTCTHFVTNGGTAWSCEEFVSDKSANKNVDTELLWENRKIVIRLLTDDFTLQCPLQSSVEGESICTDVNINRVKHVFIEIATDTQAETLTLEKDFASQKIIKDSKQSNNPSEDTKFISGISGSTPLQMTDFSQFKTNPLTCLLFFLKKLFERDKEGIIASQSEDARTVVLEILGELWYIHTLLIKYQNKISCISVPENIAAGSSAPSLEENVEHANTIFSHVKTALNLYKKPLFILACLCRASHYLSFVPIVTIIVDYSRDKGISEDYGVYILAALSGGDLIGRLFFGMITDGGFISLPRYMLIFMILNGISTMVLAFTNSILSLSIALMIYGLLQGSVFLQHPVIISKYMGRHEQSIALGCLNLFAGIIAIFVPNYIGFFRDHLGSYDGIMYISGTVAALVGSLWCFESYFLSLSQPRSRFDKAADV